MLGTLAERERLTTLNYWAGWSALVIGALFCLWAAARLFWLLLPGEQPNTSVPGPSPGVNTVASSAVPSVGFSSLPLFGRAGPASLQAVSFNAPETQLDLRLQGTLASDDPKSGLAIIADDQGNEAFYAVGDELPGDAKLHEVHAERVILSRQGQYESLSLRDDDVPGSTANQNATGASMTRPPPGTPQLAGIKGVDWSAIQQQHRINAADLAKQVQVLPFSENGKQIGVRLQAGRETALLKRLGLRPTDIITSVNGIALDDPSKAFELLRQLQSESQFNVELLRNGRESTLNINLNQ